MTGSTRTIQQPAKFGSILAAVAMAAAVLSAAAAFAWGSANLGKATQPVAAPAPIYAPAVRDLGGRDQTAPALGYHGFGARPNSTGSNEGASAGRSLAPRAQ